MIRVAAILLFTVASSATSAQVYLRGQSAPLEEAIEAIENEGVRLEGDPGELVPWHVVKLVNGEHAADAAAYAEIAARSWHATTWLARGDTALAAKPFASLFVEYRASDGPLGAVVARGHLACALQSGAHVAALAPFVSALRTRPGSGDLAFRDPLDAELGLVPSLPPFWVPSTSKRAAGVLSSSRPSESSDAMDAHSIATLYLLAAIDPPAPTGEGERVLIEHDPDDPAAALLNAIVVARIGSAEQRREQRERLREIQSEHAGTWIEAWARIGLARSLLREGDTESMHDAVLELMHVPARFADSPRLTSLALAFACDALLRAGEEGQARTIRSLLEDASDDPGILSWVESRFISIENNDPTTVGTIDP